MVHRIRMHTRIFTQTVLFQRVVPHMAPENRRLRLEYGENETAGLFPTVYVGKVRA